MPRASRTRFARYLGRGRPAYVPRDGLGPVDAIDAIRGAGGLAVLAHFAEAPDRRAGRPRARARSGLGGLEVYYRTFDQATVGGRRRPSRTSSGSLPTGGTDYHGDTGSYAEAHARLCAVADADAVRAAIGA